MERTDRVATEDGMRRLTNREFQVLQLIAAGCRNRAISQRLSISENTVESHARRLFSKLHVRSRSQAIMRADSLSLLRSGRPVDEDPVYVSEGAVMAQLDVHSVAHRHFVNMLSLVMASGQILLHQPQMTDRLRQALSDTLTQVQRVGWDLDAEPPASHHQDSSSFAVPADELQTEMLAASVLALVA
jgi:DNA-binding CsgD family transcriptional regulator